MEDYEILIESKNKKVIENIFEDIKFYSNSILEPTSPIKVNEEFFTEILLRDIEPSKTTVFSHFVNNNTKTKGAISVSLLLSSVVLLIQPTFYLNWLGVGIVAGYVGCLKWLYQ